MKGKSMAKKTHEKTPHAKMLLVALRSVGYTNEAAIADILDNSIAGSATKIELYFDWDNRRIVIADNGLGMDYQQLMDAMEIGSADPNEIRPSEDLGRFGLGMKTAAFSMAKNLLVISKKDSVVSNAEWNLDTVAFEDKWEIAEYDDSEISVILESVNTYTQYSSWGQGTLIIISDLDRLIDEENIEKSKKNFYKVIRKIKSHIAITFHRFIEEDELMISVNGNVIKPSDTVVNVRKSMWIHPVFNRAVSAREAARLQSFPDDYIFYGTKDSVYQQIGNAVPPVLGRAVAEEVLKLFGKKLRKEKTLKGIYEKFCL